MFNKNDQEMAKHVVVVFTFNDKSPMDNQAEWLGELFKDHPELLTMKSVGHGMGST